MTFVYSNWYIVMAIVAVAIAGLVTAFILMDKKDTVLIDEFIKSNAAQEPAAEPAAAEEAENKKE